MAKYAKPRLAHDQGRAASGVTSTENGAAVITRKQLKRSIKGYMPVVNEMLRLTGCELVASTGLYEWQRFGRSMPNGFSPLPAESEQYLNLDNPRLKELQARYRRFGNRVTEPLVWTEDYVRAGDVKYFRGETPYVWQERGRNMNPMGYCLTAYYTRCFDRMSLFDRLPEDDAFGAHTFIIGSRVVSRDLLDSISEINFLESQLNISRCSTLHCLDIGAGYGRLAHRMVQAFPNIGYTCTDAIAVSSFLCEYYLRFRGVDHVAKVAPLDEVEQVLDNFRVDLALNVHGFSECTSAAIAWWLDLLERREVPFLMLVPNAVDEKQRPLTNDRRDLARIIESHGYTLTAQQPKYQDPLVQEYGINPTYYYLFELR